MVFSLVADAEGRAGLSRDEAIYAIDEVNLYDRLGAEVIKEIAEAFYQRVYADKHQLSTTGESIRGVFANTTKADAVDGHFRFLVERLGGPALYTSTKGPYQLIGRHAPYAGVNDESAERWLHHMESALSNLPRVDEDSRTRLMKFFRFTAFYVVLGKQFVNCTRLLGYGQAPLLGNENGARASPVVGQQQPVFRGCPAAATMMLARQTSRPAATGGEANSD